jgi:hypothetical protein
MAKWYTTRALGTLFATDVLNLAVKSDQNRG